MCHTRYEVPLDGLIAASPASRNETSRFAWRALVLLGLGAPALGQTQIHALQGLTPDDLLVEPVAGAGDVNLDGFDDVMVRARDDLTGSPNGSVRLYSGFDGSLLHAWEGDPGYPYGFGQRIARAGDVDGDGHPDVIIGSNQGSVGPGRAYVFSGRDGSLLHLFEGDAPGDFCYHVAGAGDVDGDGHDDLLVGGTGSDLAGLNHGIARVYSGRDGSVIHTFLGSSEGSSFGVAVAGLGDLNGDGRPELAVGAPWQDSPNGSGSGRVYVYSGLDGSLFRIHDGPGLDSRLGGDVALAGDVDGDGFPDLVAGAPVDDTNGFLAGMVRVYSGAHGGILHEWFGTPEERFGWWVRGMGDVDGDGYDDVGVLSIEPKVLRVFSGQTSGELYLLGPDTLGGPVYAMDGAGDVNGDGRADFILSPGPGPYGLTYVYSGSEHLVPYCFGDGSGASCPCGNEAGAGAGCGNSSGAGATLAATGSASLGDDELTFLATDLLPSQPALLFAGLNAPNGGLGSLFGDGLRCAAGGVQRLGVRSPDGAGAASWGPGLSGSGVWSPGDLRRFQVWYRDPLPASPCGSGFNLTNGLEVVFSL